MYIPLIISIVLAQMAGLVGSLFTASSVKSWYPGLVKPYLNPPSWVFAPVWIMLYTLMAVAAYWVWRKGATMQVKTALIVYGVHLVLNALWSVIFFGLKQPGWAFAHIVLLLFVIGVVTKLFWQIDPLAGALLLPYLFWVMFATYLNFSIWRLN